MEFNIRQRKQNRSISLTVDVDREINAYLSKYESLRGEPLSRSKFVEAACVELLKQSKEEERNK